MEKSAWEIKTINLKKIDILNIEGTNVSNISNLAIILMIILKIFCRFWVSSFS